MKDFKIYIAVASACLLLYLIAQYNRPNPVDWSSTLYFNDKIPFGTYVLYNRLNDVFPEAEIDRSNRSAYRFFSDSTVTDSVAGKSTFFIVAKSVAFSKEDYTAMVKYISAGNAVFISTFDLGGKLPDTLKLNTQSDFNKKSPGLNFSNVKIRQAKDYHFDKHISDPYFSKLDTAKATVIGQNSDGKANFISYQFGKGKLFLMADPLVFSNYSLLTPQGAAYAARVLSCLPADADNVYWDQFQNHDIPVDESPMRVFFKYPALQWAYYVALASLLLFIVYEVKRRQRIIPVVEPLKNSTLEFVTVVGKVYYEQRNNANIASKKILYFAENVRNNFGLKTNSYSPESITQFAGKTGVNEMFAGELLRHINYLLPQNHITDHELIVLNQLIEKFYSQSGSYGK
ncbi:hypothetical protein A0256_03810 [Mucilaginibacter sp. PAMC 26640]|nr:hypothetical protein A0256_03810 [Mucilaginibacter sp. PAMC 26640]